ncbi:MAG: Membrane protein [Verrucomicrobia bacterium]|jgi:predicted PurR-regulated permease PerM|nr:Membrane protein [Verrucomicrobiota bacterium]
MTKQIRISYAFMFVLLLLVGWLSMATLLLTILFSYLSMRVLSFGQSKSLGVILFTLVATTAAIGLIFFTKQAYDTFPIIADNTVPAIVDYADKQGIELPFSDYESLKAELIREAKEQSARLGGFARAITFQVVYLIMGIVVAVSLFLNSRLDFDSQSQAARNNLWAQTATEIRKRFRTFFESFARVMGAQLLISSINTVMTAIFLYAAGVPHAALLTITTFLCGLLPIIGNLISNTLITGVAFTVKPEMAAIALGFLITIHKFEYFLNSKIIGDRIKNPMWLTLLALILGERLMGIPGMILAPVILHYIKVETSKQSLDGTGDTKPSDDTQVITPPAATH